MSSKPWQTAETSASSPAWSLFSPEGLVLFNPACASPGPSPLPYRAFRDVRNQRSMNFNSDFSALKKKCEAKLQEQFAILGSLQELQNMGQYTQSHRDHE